MGGRGALPVYPGIEEPRVSVSLRPALEQYLINQRPTSSASSCPAAERDVASFSECEAELGISALEPRTALLGGTVLMAAAS